MLQICSLIQDIFLLVLGIPLDLGPVTIHKGSGISYVLTKEGLEFLPGDVDCAFSLMLPLVLLLTEVDAVLKEGCCKENAVGAFGSSGGKVIFTLLTEVIVFFVRLTIIDVR